MSTPDLRPCGCAINAYHRDDCPLEVPRMTDHLATETCACGASIETNDLATRVEWRENHRCTVVPAGPCWHDSGFAGPTGAPFRCELRAGHEGAHEVDRGSWGGTAVWPNVTVVVPRRLCDTEERHLPGDSTQTYIFEPHRPCSLKTEDNDR